MVQIHVEGGLEDLHWISFGVIPSLICFNGASSADSCFGFLSPVVIYNDSFNFTSIDSAKTNGILTITDKIKIENKILFISKTDYSID